MDELQARHRKEQRDLQSRITQKKKQASKKTRKAVNDECDRLEEDLKQRQAQETAALNGDTTNGDDHDPPAEQLDDLTLQVDADDPPTNGNHTTPAQEPAPTQSAPKKRNRQKDRLARRAAEQESLAQQAADEASNLPDLQTQERDRMLAAMRTHALAEHEIRADGHCLYSAVADQLRHLSLRPDMTYAHVRADAADYIGRHGDDFAPFLEEPLAEYVRKVRATAEWGGEVELLALAKTYGVDIHVLQDFGRVERIRGRGGGDAGGGDEVMWLGYYKHGFGLGEHYNSLRKKEEG